MNQAVTYTAPPPCAGKEDKTHRSRSNQEGLRLYFADCLYVVYYFVLELLFGWLIVRGEKTGIRLPKATSQHLPCLGYSIAFEGAD